MLSKVLSDEQKSGAQPLPWKRSGGGTSVAPVVPAPATAPKPSGPVIMHRTDGGNFAPESELQQKIHALEQQLAQAQVAAQQGEQQARQSGYAEGEANGRKQAMDQIQPVLDKMAQSIAEVTALRPKLRHEAETDVIRLATAIARKILHRELVADPESLSALIRVAMDKIRANELVRVRVHPQHQAAVQQVLTRIMLGSQIDLQGDPRLQLGGVAIETTRGDFDASVETQLREIERGLADKLLHASTR